MTFALQLQKVQEQPQHKTFRQLIDKHEVAPVILLEIIADSCSLDFQYLLKCYYVNTKSSQMNDFAKVEHYLHRVFSDDDSKDIDLEPVTVLQSQS